MQKAVFQVVPKLGRSDKELVSACTYWYLLVLPGMTLPRLKYWLLLTEAPLMNNTRRRRGFLASRDGVAKLKARKFEKKYSYLDIAKVAHVTADQVRRLFNPQWGYKVGEVTVEAIARALDLYPTDIVELVEWNAYQGQLDSTPTTVPQEPIALEPYSADSEDAIVHPRVDLGEAPDVSIFSGRSEELVTLEQWLVEDRCRIVALLGLKGMGKTALSVKLAKQIAREFDCVIWRSLRQAPAIDELLTDLLEFASYPSTPYLPEDTNTLISELIKAFQNLRCLVVLDSFETILLPSQLVGQYCEGYEWYGELLRRLGSETHNSCVLLTSSEKPREITPLAGKTSPVRAWSLQGLKEADAREILKAKGLSGEDKWKTLIQLYRGNPLALKLVATTIEELFNGQVAEFIGRGMLVFGELHELLDEPFKRLSQQEKEIMYCLAIEEQPVSLNTLQSSFWLPVPPRDLFDALASLGRRCLIDKATPTIVKSSASGSESRFTLQRVVTEYVSNQLVEQLSEEIDQLRRTGEIEKTRLLRSLNLEKVSGKANKPAQVQLLLAQVADRLRAKVRSESKILEPIEELLPKLKGKPQLEVGYASRNLLQFLQVLDPSYNSRRYLSSEDTSESRASKFKIQNSK